MQPDDPRLDEDRARNVALVKKLVDAAAQDHEASSFTKGKFSRRRYEQMLQDSYPDLGNKAPLETAVRAHNIRTGKAKGNPSNLTGPDVYRVVRFFLHNLGGYGWNHFKEVIKEEGPPYTDLLILSQEEVPAEIRYQALSNQKIGDAIRPDDNPSTRMRQLADEFDLLQEQLRLSNTTQRIMIEEKIKIKSAIANAQRAFNRAVRNLDRAKSEQEREELKQELLKCSNLLENLRNIS